MSMEHKAKDVSRIYVWDQKRGIQVGALMTEGNKQYCDNLGY